MKINPLQPAHSQRGTAAIMVIVLLGVMSIMITADFRAANLLDRELRLVDQRQQQRLNPTSQPSNRIVTSALTTGANR